MIELLDDAVRAEAVGSGLVLRLTPGVRALKPGQPVLHNGRRYIVGDEVELGGIRYRDAWAEGTIAAATFALRLLGREIVRTYDLRPLLARLDRWLTRRRRGTLRP